MKIRLPQRLGLLRLSLLAIVEGILLLVMLLNLVGMLLARQIIARVGMISFQVLGWILAVLQAAFAVDAVVTSARRCLSCIQSVLDRGAL
jgi:small neutral amino acid transporter SnatA (MarC family)